MSHLEIAQCHLVHHKSYLDWRGNKSENPRWDVGHFTNFAVDASVLNNQPVSQTSILVLTFLHPFNFWERSWKAVWWVRMAVDTPLYRQTSGLPSWRQFLFPSFISCFALRLILFPSSRFFWLCKSEIGKDVLAVVVVLVLRVWYTDICQLVHWTGHGAKHSSVWPFRIRWNAFLPLEVLSVSECIWHSPPTSYEILEVYCALSREARGDAALQVVKSRVWFPMLSLEFFSDVIPPAALWLWGWLSL
jgi:hypothetical protein